jgi:hypothetical protein
VLYRRANRQRRLRQATSMPLAEGVRRSVGGQQRHGHLRLSGLRQAEAVPVARSVLKDCPDPGGWITISARRCTFDRLRRGARGRERCCSYWFSMAGSSRSQRTAGLLGFLLVGMGGRLWALLGIVQTVAIDLSVLNAPNEWHWSYLLMLLGHIVILGTAAGRYAGIASPGTSSCVLWAVSGRAAS